MDESITLDEAIDKFDALAQRIKLLAEEKRLLGEFIAGKALAEQRASNTTRVVSRCGVKLKVERKFKTEWDGAQLMTARELLGSERFDALFKTKIEFTAQKRALTAFLGTVVSDEKLTTAKEIIGNAQIEIENAPYVSVEESKAIIEVG